MIEGRKSSDDGRILHYGMVGGGPGSFIGGVHRAAIGLDGAALLVAGCFSQHDDKNKSAGRQLRVADERVYSNFAQMAEREAAREDGIDFAVITTPNMSHFSACQAFLSKGISVVCEKPLAVTLEQAKGLKQLAKTNNCLFCVAYAYTGHVMAMEARNLIKRGDIGEILMVMGEYPQDWMVDLVEQDSKQAAWRTDPKLAGVSNCTGDIGSHIENMVSFMTGLRIKQLCASLDVIGAGRTLDTNAEILLRYTNGARGCYWCSQVAIGHDNGLKVRIYGTKGAIEFEQEKSNYLKVTMKGQPSQNYSRGSGYLTPEAAQFSRTPTGHPEGYHEAYANLYKAFIQAIWKQYDGETVIEAEAGYPTVDMGIDGVRFIEKCVESSRQGTVWVDVDAE